MFSLYKLKQANNILASISKYEKKFIAENSFKNFFFDVLKNIKNNKLNIYHSAILEDARFKDQILKNNL